MGLDWNPGPKAKPGHEREFLELWTELQDKSCASREKKVQRFREITTSAFETIAAPRVGFDASATDWARKIFPNRKDKSLTEDAFLKQMQGFYVLDLAPPCDGLPRYTNGSAGGYVERYAFRGQFLNSCTEIIGDPLLESAYVSKLPEDTDRFGQSLLTAASQFALSHGIDSSKVQLAEDPDAIEFRLDVVFSAGRWCRFWAERGHWLEAYW
ncbi:MAG: hypothetical protein FWC42_09820 [Proteobacteria bacterium]|nr:hypothetical protein [Pseudomonadota bacterium]